VIMSARRLLPLLLLGWLATSCASGQVIQAKRAEFLSTIPTCEGAADCKAKWEAAQLWVVHNAGWKIQIANDVLIETFNPAQNSPAIAARVTKEPLGGGKYKLVATIWCSNMFGCVPNAWDAALAFNRDIGAIASAAEPQASQ
jgi:hypothetical protein